MDKISLPKFLRGRLRYLPILLIVLILALGGGARDQTDQELPGQEAEADADLTEAVILHTDGEAAEAVHPTAGEAFAEAETDSVIYVHICGCVRKPDVYAFDRGTRVREAVEAAGGFTEEADTEFWNLAEMLVDGEQVRIPSQEEAQTMLPAEPGGFAEADAPDAGGNAMVFDSMGRVNLNRAGMTELMSLPGIGEVKAAAILAYREEHGDFLSIEDVKNVAGIGDSSFEKIKDSIIAE